jgi:predicted small secreted protein
VLRRSTLVLALCALVAGCNEEESSKYTALQVQASLRAEGLASTMLIGSFGPQGATVSGLLKEFSGGAELGEGVVEVLSDARFDQRTGPTFRVRIFESEDAAKAWDRSPFGWERIRKGNVVADVSADRKQSVERALDELEPGTKAFTPREVADALNARGLPAHIPEGRPGLRDAFPQPPSGDFDIVIGRKPEAQWSPGRVTELLVAALVFASLDEASCPENTLGTCLEKGNVVVVVRDSRADAARAALEDLG